MLNKGFGIGDEHHPELAPSAEIFDTYREDKDWSAYEERFQPLLVERQAENVGREILTRYQTICLLCSEPTADHCHRRLVAEYWADKIPELSIDHL